jgi:superfamily II DNA or RNA helicase
MTQVARLVAGATEGQLDLLGDRALDRCVSLGDLVEARDLALALRDPEVGRFNVLTAAMGRVRLRFEPYPQPVTECSACGRRPTALPCSHFLAMALVGAAADPEWEAVLTTPAWLTVLQLGEPLDADGEEAQRHEGKVRYGLLWPPALLPTAPRGADFRTLFSRELVRFKKRGDGTLRPVRFTDWESAASKVRGLTEVDRRIDAALTTLDCLYDGLDKMSDGARARGRASIAALVAQILELLGDAELFLEGRRVQVRSEPLRPRILANPAMDGDVELGWEPGVRGLIDAQPPWVLTRADELSPLASDFPPRLIPLLTTGLPVVPREEVPRFVAYAAKPNGAPLQVADGISGVADVAPMVPELVLGEDGGALTVRARFAYRTKGLLGRVEADDPSAVVRLVGSGLVARRNFGSEAAALTALQQSGVDVPWQWKGDAAYDFLTEGLPMLPAGWAVFGEADLLRYRVRGTASPSVRFESEHDWFSLKVEFAAGGLEVPTARLLSAWLNAKRYVRLDDGSVARLPSRWLRRHADNLAELEEIRGEDGKLGAWAAPLAEELLQDVQGGDVDSIASWRRLARALSEFDGVPDAVVPEMGLTLRDYQVRGFRWLRFLYDTKLSGVLADDMGLGKTAQTLALLASIQAEVAVGPSLVVAPASVAAGWMDELQRFTPGLRAHLHYGPDREPPPLDVDVVVTTYSLLRLDAELLSGISWHAVILDEAQRIKNPNSAVADAARRLRARFRLALSGTPVENQLMELWSLFEFLMPGFFASKSAFRRRYVIPIQRNQDAEMAAALRMRIRPFVLRRLKTEVARELPDRVELVRRCELSGPERDLYERVREAFRHTVLRKVDKDGVGGASLQVLEALMRLRQACLHPSLLPEHLREGVRVGTSAKIETLLEIVEECTQAGHRALVFSQWPSLLTVVGHALDRVNVTHQRLDGSTPTPRRKKLVDAWNAPEGPGVFLISLRAGGTGLNLTAASVVIHLDPWWNPAIEAQATDRAHRIGQTQTVTAYKLIAAGTVEEMILALQARKRALVEATIDADRILVDALTREDLAQVFGGPPPPVRLSEDVEAQAAGDQRLPDTQALQWPRIADLMAEHVGPYEAARRAFGGTMEGTGWLRFHEWLLFEGRSEPLLGAVVATVAEDDKLHAQVLALANNRFGVFEVDEMLLGGKLVVVDVRTGQRYDVADATAARRLSLGAIIVGRIYPRGRGLWAWSNSARIYSDARWCGKFAGEVKRMKPFSQLLVEQRLGRG